ncbi:MAG: hypothetical protein ACYSVY_12845 [Planctomycetota bacterium]|jgi:hypothetical protein
MDMNSHHRLFASKTVVPAVCIAVALWAAPAGAAVPEHPLVGIMQSELDLSMEKLVAPDGAKPYFVQYTVTDEKDVNISATLGSVTFDLVDHSRLLDPDVRCGDYRLDSTHQIRGGYYGGYDWGAGWNPLPLNDDPIATRHVIWLATDERFKAAAKRLAEVKANVKVKVEEEDLSDDFSREESSVHIGPWVEMTMDRKKLADRVREYSRRFRAHPLIYSSSVSLSGQTTNRLVVNSEASKLQFGRSWWRIGIFRRPYAGRTSR